MEVGILMDTPKEIYLICPHTGGYYSSILLPYFSNITRLLTPDSSLGRLRLHYAVGDKPST